jgi:hypothetical protein
MKRAMERTLGVFSATVKEANKTQMEVGKAST